MPGLIDVSRPLSPATAPWPGDEGFDCGFSATLADGAAVNVGWLRMGVHNGTHVDAPYHFDDDGATADALPLDAFTGPCRVVSVPAGRPVGPDDVGELARGERLLLRGFARVDPTVFPDPFHHPTVALARAVAEAGVPLLGTDGPSMDGRHAKDLAAHRALAAGGVQILENLDLTGVPDGRYTLHAFPLRLAGMDGAPVRAVLVPR